MSGINIPESLFAKHIANCNGSRTGATILLYRQMSGMTAKDLGAASTLSPSTIRRLEQGNAVNAPTVAAVEAGLGMEPGSILREYFAEQDLKVTDLPDDILAMVLAELSKQALESVNPTDDAGRPYSDEAVKIVTSVLERADLEVTEHWASRDDQETIYADLQILIDEEKFYNHESIIDMVMGNVTVVEANEVAPAQSLA